MKKLTLLALSLILFALPAHAGSITADELHSEGSAGMTIYNGKATLTLPTSVSVNDVLLEKGNPVIHKQLRLLYDYGASGSNATLTLGSLPAKAVITGAYVDTITSPAGAGAKIALYLANGANILDDTAVASLAAGLHAANPVNSAASAIKLKAASNIVMAVDGGTLTAGRIVYLIEYFQSF